MNLTERIQQMRAGTFAAVAIGATLTIGGVACSVDNHHPERRHAPASTVPATAPAGTDGVVIIPPATLTPATCDTWAQRVEEDEVPATSPSGAGIVDYDGGGAGCAVYGDGFAYDGDGWHEPSEVTP